MIMYNYMPIYYLHLDIQTFTFFELSKWRQCQTKGAFRITYFCFLFVIHTAPAFTKYILLHVV